MARLPKRDQRALEALALRRQNMTVVEIAKYLGLAERGAYRALSRGKELMRLASENFDGAFHLGETLDALLITEKKALERFERVDQESSVGVGYLNAAMGARKEILRLLQDCGAVFKMPVVVEDDISFLHPETRKEYLQLKIRDRQRRKEMEKENG